MQTELSSDRSAARLEEGFRWPETLFLCAVAAFLYLFLFELPATPFFGDGDQSIFLYEAARMLDGDVIYRDFFEFTLPGSQVYYALMFAIFGKSFWIVSVTVLILGTLTAALMLAISRRVLPSPYYFLPTALYVFFGFRWVGFDGSHRMFSPVFVLLAVLLVMKARSLRNMVLAGLSLAVASFFTQQRGFIVAAAVIAFLIIEKLYRRSNFREFVTHASALMLPLVLGLAVLCSYFIFAAGADNFFSATLVYPFKWYGYGHPNNFGVFFVDLAKALDIRTASDLLALGPVALHCIILPIVLVVFFARLIIHRRSIDWKSSADIVLVGLGGLFLTFTITAPNMFRLFQISSFGLIVLVWMVREYLPGIFNRAAAAALCVMLIGLGAFQAIRVQTNWNVMHLDLPVGRLALVESKQAERYKWLSENTLPGDYFFEVYEPFVYFPLGLKNPTRFGQIWPSDYTRPEHVAEVIKDLREKRPRYILWDNSYFSPARAAGDHTGPLADLVAADYSPIGEAYDVGGKPVQIWEIKRK